MNECRHLFLLKRHIAFLTTHTKWKPHVNNTQLKSVADFAFKTQKQLVLALYIFFVWDENVLLALVQACSYNHAEVSAPQCPHYRAELLTGRLNRIVSHSQRWLQETFIG